MTPSVLKELLSRHGNIDIAVNANGVSGDYFHPRLRSMSFREGNTFNAVQQQDRAQCVRWMPTRDASYFQIKRMS